MPVARATIKRENAMLADIIGPDGLIILVVLVIVVLFGGKQIPKLARSLGSAQKEFKKGLEEGAQDTGAQDEAGKGPGASRGGEAGEPKPAERSQDEQG